MPAAAGCGDQSIMFLGPGSPCSADPLRSGRAGWHELSRLVVRPAWACRRTARLGSRAVMRGGAARVGRLPIQAGASTWITRLAIISRVFAP
jgi:hypothetical protein